VVGDRDFGFHLYGYTMVGASDWFRFFMGKDKIIKDPYLGWCCALNVDLDRRIN